MLGATRLHAEAVDPSGDGAGVPVPFSWRPAWMAVRPYSARPKLFLLSRGKECLVGRRRMESREWRARKGSPVAGGASPPVAEDVRGRKERGAREEKPGLQRPSCVGFKGGRTMWKGKEGERGEKGGKGGGRAGGREGKKSFPLRLPGLP
ncbi:hypothetical protein Naga_101209g3 [Nannochloropsis gaditana]|uniref:Uncharacterized protein n=1 Tax=Nannochloropsis gaditana TaxID=72520 RepID=W7T8Y1_9STRA|nr:hypothetical protein Naga_101209g3 [Nannochloropsis gaditana]